MNEWLADETMIQITRENHLSETAFIVKEGLDYKLRWFTTGTAKGKEFDCVSRSFAPKCNVPEDPVCSSGHCHIIPFWANRLGKKDLVAYQASLRGGTLYCEYQRKRVKLSGKAALYSIADINF